MSDYRRLISYIYTYEGNIKGKNIGYAKIEVRGDQCRIYVNVRNCSIGMNEANVYLMTPKIEISLGRIHLRNGSGEFRAVVNADNILQKSQKIQDCYGLSIHDTGRIDRRCATIWEDAVAYAAEVESGKAEPEKENQEILADGVSGKDEIGETAEKESESVESVESEKSEGSEKSDNSKEDQDSSSEFQNKEDIRKLESEIPWEEPDHLCADDIWSMMQKKYPRMQAFDYENGCEILRIRPQDIGLLPREMWGYGNNSFLLHGYYSFRYLIFARLEIPGGEPRYLLGVPGHYFRAEKNMAAMFGFSHFVLAKTQPMQEERFGYWYTDIRMQ